MGNVINNEEYQSCGVSERGDGVGYMVWNEDDKYVDYGVFDFWLLTQGIRI